MCYRTVGNTIMNKHDQRKEEIITAAFIEWGKTKFRNTSLSSLAREVGMTKPALYRYFSKKDDILKSMKIRFSSAYGRIVREFMDLSSGQGIQEIVHSFNKSHTEFFLENPEYYLFLFFYIMKEPVESTPLFYDILAKQTKFLGDYFPEPAVSIPYFINTLVFFLSRILCFDDTNLALIREDNKGIIDDIDSIFLNGFLNSEKLSNIDFNSIEKICLVDNKPRELREPIGSSKKKALPVDRIFTAITDVVARDGIWEASIEKIARRAGMSKSSLYFHFNGKEDMLSQMIEREYKVLFKLFMAEEENIHSFTEYVFSFLVITVSHLLNNPTVLSVLNWFRIQRGEIKHHPPKNDFLINKFFFIKEAFDSGKLISNNLDLYEIIIYLNFQVIRETMDSYKKKRSVEEALKRIRVIYKLFMNGILRLGDDNEQDD